MKSKERYQDDMDWDCRTIIEHKNRSFLPVVIIAIVLFVVSLFFAIKTTVTKCSTPINNVLVVGTNTPFPPFENVNGAQVEGFDIDLVEKIGKALNKKITYKIFTTFDAMLPALKTGDIDMVASAVTIRSDRDELFDFSDSYYQGAQAVITNKSSILNLGCNVDFGCLKIGCQKGTTSEFWIDSNLVDRVNIKEKMTFDDMDYGLQLLRLKSVDVVILDMPVAANFVKIYPLRICGIFSTGEQYGFVVQDKDPKKLLPVINSTLKELKANGEYQKLVNRWFGGSK